MPPLGYAALPLHAPTAASISRWAAFRPHAKR